MTITRICNRLWYHFLGGGETRQWYSDGMDLAHELEKKESLENETSISNKSKEFSA